MKNKTIIKDQNGATVIEFALVLPLLMVFVFGIIEFSLLSYNKAMITQASRAGARAGIVYAGTRPDNTAIENVVNNYRNKLITFGSGTPPEPQIIRKDKDGGTITDLTDVASGSSLTVTVSYTYTFLVFPNLIELIKGSFVNTIDLSATTVMRYE